MLEQVPRSGTIETAGLAEADGRVLAEDVAADRDYPAVARSVRDGFALRSSDTPQGLRVIGEVRAGQSFEGKVGAGEAVEIMTGAPMPEGADAVVMVEHITRDGEQISTDRTPKSGDNVNPAGSEARSGDLVLKAGRRLDYASIALAATLGRASLRVYRKPRVAILSTGDEVVGVEEQPREYQVRNSNAWSVAAQVKRAGGVPEILATARDTHEHTLQQIELGLAEDLLLLTGGVSAGKYDVVEQVLADLGAEFFFDRVKIQPGQPLVFGRCRGKFFFGLPGNPISTMVTFEAIARIAVERLSGVAEPALPLPYARLTAPLRHKPGLTRFLPAWLNGSELTPIRWGGSSDVPAVARANAFLMADEEKENYEAGDLIQVLLR